MNTPQIAWLNLNRKCNNRCDFCYARDAIVSQEEMNYDDTIHYIEMLKSINVRKVILIGGEPTLYHRFGEIIKAIHDSGMICAVQTNGLRFSDEAFLRSCIAAGMDECCVSIKGFNQKAYFKTTATDLYGTICTAIENIKRSNYNMLYSYTLTHNSCQELEDILKGVRLLNLSNIYFQTVHPTFCINEIYIEQNFKEWVAFYESLNIGLSSMGVSHQFSVNFPLCMFPHEEAVSWLKEGILHQNTCQLIMGTGIIFDTDFQILPCNMFVKKPFAIENRPLDSCALLEEWKNTQNHSLRDEARSYPSDACADCYRWSQCHAGCPARWKHVSPKNYQFEPFSPKEFD